MSGPHEPAARQSAVGGTAVDLDLVAARGPAGVPPRHVDVAVRRRGHGWVGVYAARVRDRGQRAARGPVVGAVAASRVGRASGPCVAFGDNDVLGLARVLDPRRVEAPVLRALGPVVDRDHRLVLEPAGVARDRDVRRLEVARPGSDPVDHDVALAPERQRRVPEVAVAVGGECRVAAQAQVGDPAPFEHRRRRQHAGRDASGREPGVGDEGGRVGAERAGVDGRDRAIGIGGVDRRIGLGLEAGRGRAEIAVDRPGGERPRAGDGPADRGREEFRGGRRRGRRVPGGADPWRQPVLRIDGDAGTRQQLRAIAVARDQVEPQRARRRALGSQLERRSGAADPRDGGCQRQRARLAVASAGGGIEHGHDLVRASRLVGVDADMQALRARGRDERSRGHFGLAEPERIARAGGAGRKRLHRGRGRVGVGGGQRDGGDHDRTPCHETTHRGQPIPDHARRAASPPRRGLRGWSP